MYMLNEILQSADQDDCDAKEVVRRKLYLLVGQQLQNFQQSILINRRRCQQRMRQRQARLRAFFIQELLNLETSFIELIPLAGACNLGQHNNTESTATACSSLISTKGAVPRITYDIYQQAWFTFNFEDWLDAFRMSRSTFKWICEQLGDSVPPLKDVDSAKSRVAIGMHALASGENAFIISKASVALDFEFNSFMLSFGEALYSKIGKALIVMPHSEKQWHDIRVGFQQKTNIPPVVCGMLTTCTLQSGQTKLDKPRRRTVGGSKCHLQMLFDDRMIVRRLIAQELRPVLFLYGPNAISRRVVQLQEPLRPDQNRAVSCCIVTAPSYYPLRSWIMKRYAKPRVPHEYDFNEAIDNVLGIKNRALVRLFARWSILRRNINADADSISTIAIACCTLHNIVEMREPHIYRERWEAGLDLSKYEDVSAQHPVTLPNDKTAEVTRNFLARVVSSTEPMHSS